MKWKYETWRQKLERLENWHRWFAWHPVWDEECGYWLEYVDRKGHFVAMPDVAFWNWSYRKPPAPEPVKKENQNERSE